MKIKSITFEHRNDFNAIMRCEHCNAEQMNDNGYHDNHYHTKVIPAMHCGACGMNRSGVEGKLGHTPYVPTENTPNESS